MARGRCRRNRGAVRARCRLLLPSVSTAAGRPRVRRLGVRGAGLCRVQVRRATRRPWPRRSRVVGSDHDSVGRGRDHSRYLASPLRRGGPRRRAARRVGVRGRRRSDCIVTLGPAEL